MGAAALAGLAGGDAPALEGAPCRVAGDGEGMGSAGGGSSGDPSDTLPQAPCLSKQASETTHKVHPPPAGAHLVALTDW